MDMTASIIPKSDQLNADDLISGTVTVTIERVSAGNAEQPFDFHLVEFPGRAFRPSKSMRRVIVTAWGAETDAYIGRRMTLYREPTIRFGKDEVGGIRISHMSHIDRQVKIALTVKRGQRDPFIVEPLTDPAPQPALSLTDRISKMVTAFDVQGVTVGQLETRVGNTRGNWTTDDIDAMTAVYQQLKAGGDKDELFPIDPTFPQETP